MLFFVVSVHCLTKYILSSWIAVGSSVERSIQAESLGNTSGGRYVNISRKNQVGEMWQQSLEIAIQQAHVWQETFLGYYLLFFTFIYYVTQ